MYNPQQQIQRLRQMRTNIDDQIAQWQNMPQQPTIQQNFITTPVMNDFDAKWVNGMEDVKNATVSKETIFMEREHCIFHIKTPNNEIKSFSFQEYVYLDEKDIKIKELEEKLLRLENALGKEVDLDGKPANGNVWEGQRNEPTLADNSSEPNES